MAPPETMITLISACDMNQIGRFNVPEIPDHIRGRCAALESKEEKLIFTSSITRAQMDSRDRVMVFVGVEKKFLTKIADSLNGWSCPRGTPMEVIKVHHGRPTLKLSR